MKHTMCRWDFHFGKKSPKTCPNQTNVHLSLYKMVAIKHWLPIITIGVYKFVFILYYSQASSKLKLEVALIAL
jgi:hypothetical protein